MEGKEMQSNEKSEPTKGELEVLQVLWKHGPSTVRFVNDTLNAQKRAVQYTSTLKLMQLMIEKGMLARDENQMKHIYYPSLEEEQTKGFLLKRFLETTYEGSASKLMMQLLGNHDASKEEIQKIKGLLGNLEE